MANLSLLSTTSRVAVPFVRVTIGDYTFGAFRREEKRIIEKGVEYKELDIQYPQFIKSLSIKKINGKVNRYNLDFTYPITADDDPNFFEKVFSSVSKTRKIKFSYGDLTAPTYLYKEEEGVIIKVTSTLDTSSSVMDYHVEAISSSILTMVGDFVFDPYIKAKPSDVIKKLLTEPKYGLRDVFTGMRNIEDLNILIPSTDKPIQIPGKNCSIFTYLTYLVDSMIPIESNPFSEESLTTTKKHYVMVLNDDTSGKYGGPYFEIKTSDKKMDSLDTYILTYGYPETNIITSFRIVEDETYSILFDYAGRLNQAEYKQRINDQGELEEYYKPVYSLKSSDKDMVAEEINWWSKITQYPIKVEVTVKGLLRPALLMSYVRLDILLYGKKHISSGLYIITQQIDTVSEYRGFETNLSLTRIDTYNREDFQRLKNEIEIRQYMEVAKEVKRWGVKKATSYNTESLDENMFKLPPGII